MSMDCLQPPASGRRRVTKTQSCFRQPMISMCSSTTAMSNIVNSGVIACLRAQRYVYHRCLLLNMNDLFIYLI